MLRVASNSILPDTDPAADRLEIALWLRDRVEEAQLGRLSLGKVSQRLPTPTRTRPQCINQHLGLCQPFLNQRLGCIIELF